MRTARAEPMTQPWKPATSSRKLRPGATFLLPRALSERTHACSILVLHAALLGGTPGAWLEPGRRRSGAAAEERDWSV